uniref:Uncharacterized protein n=1 Tax=Oryza meridionalis TaxID=40149 RepID=A0A0E0CE75_9ORYZ
MGVIDGISRRCLSSSMVVALQDGVALTGHLRLGVDTHLLRHRKKERRAIVEEYKLGGHFVSLLFSNKLVGHLYLGEG